MEWLTEPFALGFQQRALIGGAIAGVMCAVVGTWLVLRGMSFFGDAFVHGIVPGTALAALLDYSPLLGAAGAALMMVAGIELVHRQTALKEDTGIGLLFVGVLALGVVVISRSDSYNGSLTTILFGDALGVTRDDLMVQGALALLVIAAAIALYRPLLALAFDRTKAQVLGMQPRRTHGSLLALIAAAVIGSYQAVGTLLVFGLLVGPPASRPAGSNRARHGGTGDRHRAGVGVGRACAQLLPRHCWTATMALVPILLFFFTLTVVGTRRRLRHRADPSGPSAEPAASAMEPVS